MIRYSDINTKLPREFLLLQGTGCRWKKCSFCDYYNDTSKNPYEVNKNVLNMVTGKYGVLDVINSGSALELDPETIKHLQKTVNEKNIKTLWFESHYMYRHKLNDFAALFPECKVKFRCGVETFNPVLRKIWNKGIPASVTPDDIAKYFKGICLLIGVKGQSFETIEKDILTAEKYYEYFSINAFVENSTPLKRDDALIERFKSELLPDIRQKDGIEILIDNTDLGIG